MSATICWRPAKISKPIKASYSSSDWEKISEALGFSYQEEITLRANNRQMLWGMHCVNHKSSEKSLYSELCELVEKHEEIILTREF